MDLSALLFLSVIGLLLWVILSYNRFIQLSRLTDEAWADIDVQLRRRYDLIPNLVNVVKTYAGHEKALFEEVTKARSKALQARSVHEKEVADHEVHSMLGKVLAVAENYPQLRASENFAKLQDELTETENIIASARRYYNGNVRDLNTQIAVFPNNLLSRVFNFRQREYFELEEEAAKSPIKVVA